MLQGSELQLHFNHVEQAIGHAAQACSAERDVPGELRDCIKKLDKQSDLAKEVLQSCDEMKIRKMVDELEELGDRAKRVCCSGAANLTSQMKNAVMRMHDELARLKHQLH